MHNIPNRGLRALLGRRFGYETAGKNARYIFSIDQNHRIIGCGALGFIQRTRTVANRRFNFRNRAGSKRSRDCECQRHPERRENRHYQTSDFDREGNVSVPGSGQRYVRSHSRGPELPKCARDRHCGFNQPDHRRADCDGSRRDFGNHHGQRRRRPDVGNLFAVGGQHPDDTDGGAVAGCQSQQCAGTGPAGSGRFPANGWQHAVQQPGGRCGQCHRGRNQ